MNESEREELLSAYLDGELAPSVRTEIDNWLDSSADARQSLVELRRLSGLLRELPRLEMPDEFASEVMRHAERRMLLPEVAASRVRRGRWVLYLGGPLAAAAMLLVFINLNREPDPRPDGAAVGTAGRGKEIAKRDQSQPAGRPAEKGQSAIPGETAGGTAVAAPVAADKSRSAGSSSVPARQLSADAADAILGAKTGKPTSLIADAKDTSRDGKSRASQIGEMIVSDQRMSADENVAVIRLQIADEFPGMKLVLMAFDEHAPSGKAAAGVAREPETPTLQLPNDGDLDAASKNQLEGFYVVVTPEHLNRVLETVFADPKVIEGQIRIEAEAVKIAALPQALQLEIQNPPESRKEAAAVLARPRSADFSKKGTERSLKSPAASDDKEDETESVRAKKGESRRVDKPELREKSPVTKELRTATRKQLVMLPPDYRRDLARQDRPLSKRTEGDLESQNVAKKKVADQPVPPIDYVRVLFVIEPRPSQPTKPASDAKPGSSGGAA